MLDSKRPEDAALIAGRARASTEFYGDAPRAHFEVVREGLDAARHPLPRSTRDWCAASTTTVRTTFEYAGGTLDSAQNALGGGGRYDGLVESLGGPPTPGIGFALGVDRTLLACDDEGVFAGADGRSTCSSSTPPAARAALAISDELRARRRSAPTGPSTAAP